MSTVSVYPDATIDASLGTKTGAATTHECLDASTASYMVLWPEAGWARVSATTPTKPAGSVTKQVRAVGSFSSISVNSSKFDLRLESGFTVPAELAGVELSGTTPTHYATAWVNLGDLSAAALGDLILGSHRSTTGAVTNLRNYALWLEIVFALQPVVDITAVTGGAATASTVTWAHTPGEDGGPQVWYRAWLTNAAGSAVYDTGPVRGGATSTVATGLAPDAYRWHVQTAQEVHSGVAHWAAEDFWDFNITAPGVATVPKLTSVVATPDDVYAVTEVDVVRDATGDTWVSSDVQLFYADGATFSDDIETGTAGVADDWAIETFNTTSAESQSIQPGGESGNFQRFAATVGVGSHIRFAYHVRSLPCQAGDTVYATVRLKGSRTGTAFARWAVGFSTSGPNEAGWQFDGPDGTWIDLVPTGSWQTVRVSFAVPAGMRSFRVSPQLVGGASGGSGVIDFDLVSVGVSSAGWRSVRAIPTPTAAGVTVFDFEAPPDTELTYRANATDADGIVSPWMYAVPVDWTAAGFKLWLVPTDNPGIGVDLRLAEPPSRTRTRREARLAVLGAAEPVFRSDVLSSSEGEFVVITENEVDGTALEAVAESGVVAVHAPTVFRFPSGYYRLGNLQEVHIGQPAIVGWRYWRLPFTEVARPA